MSFTHNQVEVTTSATLIHANNSGDSSSVKIKDAAGGQDVFLGGASVTTSNGFRMAAGEVMTVDLDPGEALYGIVAATTQEVSFLAFD